MLIKKRIVKDTIFHVIIKLKVFTLNLFNEILIVKGKILQNNYRRHQCFEPTVDCSL